MDDSTRFLRKFITLVHYDKPHNSLPFILMMIIAALAIINGCMVVLSEKENLEKCLLGMKDIAAITTLFSGIVERSLKPEKAMKLIELIEDRFFINERGGEGRWKKFELYYEKKRKSMRGLWNKLSTVIVIVFVAAVFRNLFNDLLLKSGGGGSTKTKDWPTPFVYWCPSWLDSSFAFFVFIFSFQGLLLAFVAIEAFCIQLSVCLATEKVLADFETIYMLLKDLADDFSYGREDGWGKFDNGDHHEDGWGKFDNEDHHEDGWGMRDNGDHLEDGWGERDDGYWEKSYKYRGRRTEVLRKDMGRIVECHQKLNRDFKHCAQNSAYVILITSCGMSVDTCVNIYIMLKADDLQTSFNYALACFFINLIVFFSYHTGQRIVNQIMKAALSFGHFLYTTKLKGQIQQ
ncbi:hypothetical protein LSTR_LSTR013324 [Laodelphax striatellus]|uniref:Odorant receptor n=1 Tax=Laodelphax striatellus TaxID=195883 RepID=A0A482WQL8_LAOST|nr:hypothetical protein LSTR_LSTR013324 [Laodelphax striatellus]